MNSKENNKFSNWMHVLNLIIVVMFPFITAYVGWVANQVIENKADIRTIQGNRFTSIDALQWQKQYNADINIIKDALRDLDKKIPKKVPPDWFEDRVDRLEQKIEIMNRKIEGIERKVNIQNLDINR